MKDKWIAGAIKHPGSLTRAAQRAHKGVMTYAREHMHDPGVLGKRARLALTLRGLSKRH